MVLWVDVSNLTMQNNVFDQEVHAQERSGLLMFMCTLLYLQTSASWPSSPKASLNEQP
jgi:hypothetical protein